MSQNIWSAYYENTQGRIASNNLLRALRDSPYQPKGSLAIDLGCGAGQDTLELLKRGWRVLAIDSNLNVNEYLASENFSIFQEQLTVICERFQTAYLPPAHLINANLALPFCPPHEFPDLWTKINNALQSGGVFSGNFFGLEDDWIEDKSKTFLSDTHISNMFSSWEIQLFEERREIGPTAYGGMKRWHIIDVVARRK